MGSGNSKEEKSTTFRSSSSSWNNEYPSQPGYSTPYYSSADQYYPAQSPYPPQSPYPVQQPYAPPTTSNYGGYVNEPKRKLDRRYSRIVDEYSSLQQVTEALARAGLESSNLIVGIDFTKSNEWTGAKSFNKKSLHHIGDELNPYEKAISIVGRTLAAFDDDNLIPCFGFGDASTHDQDVFSFYPDERCCNGFEEVLFRYRELVPHIRLAGPTSFAPIIEMAMTIVEHSGGQYHVLLIIADGQVTRSVDTEHGRLSPQEQKTVDAIVEASKYPLSIILVGVGDGPWDTMKEFDDNIPARDFDNFQFVNFTNIMAKNAPQTRKETEFALAALMEIPSQYKAALELNILGRQRGTSPERVALPPPLYNAQSMRNSSSYDYSNPSPTPSFKPGSSYYGSSGSAGTTPSAPTAYNTSLPAYNASPPAYNTNPPAYSTSPPAYNTSPPAYSTSPPASSSTYDNLLCPICLTNNKDMAFGCGHQTCCECGQDLQNCPMCRSTIQTRIKLY